ncbi:DNA polymerase III subunit delta [Aquabacterium sp.]|uniref:DNA polymerase III subunit delta n=1 Tax=Aquabacterium sp. TaxID=1872578 RepID=UPI0035B0349B
MQLRPEQLAEHLKKGLKPLYVLHGDEPLLVQEAGDAIRAAARDAGHTERQTHTVAGAHFDWSAVLASAGSMSLFADKQIVEIRVPSGKPGKEGSEALQRYCDQLCDDVLTLVVLPRLDRAQQGSAWFTALDGAGVSVKIDAVERNALPAWIARRLAAQGQRVAEGEAGQQALAFFADRVEGNLLAAHQEITKLGLLYPAGELSLEQIEAAVVDVARFNVFKLSEAVLAGQTARVMRMLDGLRAEGEAAVLVQWTLTEDVLGLHRVHAAMAGGKPLPMALREQRVWGVREKLFERLVPRLDAHTLARLVSAAAICDGVVKGIKHPQWPDDPWAALQRLALMVSRLATPQQAARVGRI